MAHTVVKTLLAGAAALSIAACGQGLPQTRSAAGSDAAVLAAKQEADRPYEKPVKELGRVRLDETRLTPEGAEGKAWERARNWQPDAELRFVGWGVLKLQLASACSHVFYSPKADQVLVVHTLVADRWQRADVYDQPVVVKPAHYLNTLRTYNVDAKRALGLARQYFFQSRPVSLVMLSHPHKMRFAFWGVVADNAAVLVHADNGTSISNRGFDLMPKEWTRSR